MDVLELSYKLGTQETFWCSMRVIHAIIYYRIFIIIVTIINFFVIAVFRGLNSCVSIRYWGNIDV